MPSDDHPNMSMDQRKMRQQAMQDPLPPKDMPHITPTQEMPPPRTIQTARAKPRKTTTSSESSADAITMLQACAAVIVGVIAALLVGSAYAAETVITDKQTSKGSKVGTLTAAAATGGLAGFEMAQAGHSAGIHFAAFVVANVAFMLVVGIASLLGSSRKLTAAKNMGMNNTESEKGSDQELPIHERS